MVPDPLQMFPEFDVSDWSRLKIDRIPHHRITGFVTACLQDREVRSLTMHRYGSLVLSASRSLLARTRKELTERLGTLTKIMEDTDGEKMGKTSDWSKYKRQERACLAREMWAFLRKRKERMQALAKLFPRRKACALSTDLGDTHVISVFAEQFVTEHENTIQFDEKLREIVRAGLSRQLPWKQILGFEIWNGNTRLGHMAPVVTDQRKDIVFKFQCLLELAHENQVELSQDCHFGEIRIKPGGAEITPGFTLKDRSGREYWLAWSDLTQSQRKKVIDDLQCNRVLLA